MPEDIEGLGYTLNEDGYYEKDGKELSFKYLRMPEVPTSNGEGLMLQAQMKDIGIMVDFDDIPSGSLRSYYTWRVRGRPSHG